MKLARVLLVLAAWLAATAASAQAPGYLDVGVVVFDPGLAEAVAPVPQQEFPQIRKAEAIYQAVQLRRVLESDGLWGAVRVMPQASELVELTISARILTSSGEQLSLAVTATDASGRQWLQGTYEASASDSAYPVAPGTDPFDSLYRRIASELAGQLAALPAQSREQLQTIARLRYANSLAPEAFAGYLSGGGEVPYTLQRLPAEDDPMLQRVERIRQQEYLFIDNVDEQYARLHDELQPTYDLWRQNWREQAVYEREYAARASERESSDRRGSYAAMLSDYSTYRAFRIRQQDLDELAKGFNNEVGPTVVESRGQVFRLSGSLESRYQDWRRILREIFALEMGELPGQPVQPTQP
ncbi:hypothetical protein [Haliea sp. E17]|uniref:hypothetical protein n=1 Tax=Haliea sp. E17 TaxID=3401576 RepID=UPI003AAFEC67